MKKLNTAVIGVGSNIDPAKNIRGAKLIFERAKILRRTSHFQKTAPIGGSDQPDFLNGAFLVETEMGKSAFKRWMRGVEKRLGRVKGADKHGPRTIDLDIVVWNGKITDDDFYEREFLRDAVMELLPGFMSSSRSS